MHWALGHCIILRQHCFLWRLFLQWKAVPFTYIVETTRGDVIWVRQLFNITYFQCLYIFISDTQNNWKRIVSLFLLKDSTKKNSFPYSWILTCPHDSNRCIFSAHTHTKQRLIQCSSSCLFSHGQTEGCTSSLLIWMGFISLSLRGIVKNLFTNQFYTQEIYSMIIHTQSTLRLFNPSWMLQLLQNYFNRFMPDAVMMYDVFFEIVFILSII